MENLGSLSVAEFLAKLKADAARERRIEREAREKAEAAEAGVAYLEALLPPVLVEDDPLPSVGEAEANGDGPRGEAAVLAVMREKPHLAWQTADIHETLEEREWIAPGAKHPRAGVEAALSRLVKKGALLRVDRGIYRLARREGAFEED